MICGLSYYQICLFFLIYSFLGWVLEVVFHAVVLGKIINRGFLNGPVCPVYAFGALGILALVNTLEAHGILSSVSSPDIRTAGLSLAEGKSHYSREALELLLLFLIGMALTTLVELIAGWLLYTLFHARWWDYSNLPFNFHGYICLKFSILWGIAVVFAVRILHPIIQRGSSEMIPPDWGWPCMAVLYMIYLIDLIVTAATVRGLNKRLEELDKIRAAMRVPSDAMTEKIGKTSMMTAQKIGEGQVQAALMKAEIKAAAEEKRTELIDSALDTRAALKKTASDKKKAVLAAGEKGRNALYSRARELRREILEHSHFGPGRLLRAFPGMVHRDYDEVLRELRMDNRTDEKMTEDEY